jgi:hypothetical protein
MQHKLKVCLPAWNSQRAVAAVWLVSDHKFVTWAVSERPCSAGFSQGVRFARLEIPTAIGHYLAVYFVCPMRSNGVEFRYSSRCPMSSLRLHWRKSILGVLLCFTYSLFVVAADEQGLTKEQIKQFLLTAKVVGSKVSSKGITHPARLTLSDGTITHDASFQVIDEHKAIKELGIGSEINFVDSYKYNIAAYQLAELIGMDDMLPVYVERKWQGHTGSLSWWLPVKMDEAERYKQKLAAPDVDAWNNQMYKIRVFDQLVADTDPNLTNVLIGENWEIWRIDFSRAFRLNKDVKNPKDLVRCDRQLLEKLKALDGDVFKEKTKLYLTKDEASAVMARRDKIVAQFQKMIVEKGEKEVLY